ncbi:MAG: WXG100 family type VII secretion target [Anaerorhabdus sp.]
MKKIYVDPVTLERNSTRIDQLTQDYKKQIKMLIDEVEKMRAAWQGSDNQAFTNKIYSFESDFNQVAILCDQYSEFLRISARSYRDIQDELVAQANKI